jgi:hypothetical protein
MTAINDVKDKNDEGKLFLILEEELNKLDCYCGACMAPLLIGSFFTRQLKYSTDLSD